MGYLNLFKNIEDSGTYFLFATCDAGCDLSTDINWPRIFRLPLFINPRDVSEGIVAQSGRPHFGQKRLCLL